MDDKVNTTQEYAGPPKSHDFRSNASGVNAPVGKVESKAPAVQKKQTEPDLLSIISAGDKKPEQTKQKKKMNISFDLKEVYAYKRKVNEYLKKQSNLWNALNSIWMFFKVVFYLIGMGFFAICLFLYFHFESVVKTYLQKHNLNNVSVEQVVYSRADDILTISFNNVKEKNGLFSIAKINASFSFAGLLDKKIQMVGLDGLRLFRNSKKPLAENFQELTRVLWSVGVLDNRSWFSVQSLRLDDAVMYVQTGSEYMPVNLSGVGTLTGKKQLTLPISFDGKNGAVSADVQLDISSSGVDWTVDILSGNILLPSMEKQNLRGKITAKTSKGKVLSFNFLGSLSKDGFDKDVDIQLTRNQKNLYALKSTMTVKGKTDVGVEFNAYNLLFADDLSSMSTDSPIFLKISNIKNPELSFETAQLSSTGRLTCTFDGCTYYLDKLADLVFFSPYYRWMETSLFVPFPLRLPLLPSKEKLFSIDKKGIEFNLPVDKTEFSARKSRLTRDPSTTSISLNGMNIKANYDVKEKTLKGTASADIESLTDDTISFSNGKLQLKFTESSFGANLQAQKMRFNETPYFKLPVSVNASFNDDYYFAADLNAMDNWLAVSVNGYYYPYTGEVIMGVKTKNPVVFSENSPSLFEISELFSPDIQNMTGKVNFDGEIHYSNLRSVSGPLKVLLDDVSFKMGNMEVDGLTSVLNLTQIVPLGGQGVQEMYAESLKTSVPFENISAQVVFDASRKQFNLSSMDTTVAGYHLRADPMWYGYDAPSYIFSLKGKTVSLQTIADNMVIPDLKITGSGSVSLSAQVRDNQFILRNLELNVPSEGLIQYTPDKYISPYLENLKSLDFKRLNAFLTQQGDVFEFVFSADNKISKLKKKTSFRLNLKEALSEYIKKTNEEKKVPNTILKAKDAF